MKNQKQINTLFRRNPDISVLTLYKHFRNDPNYHYYGDYPLIASAVLQITKKGRMITRRQVFDACNKSKDYLDLDKKIKSKILDNLLLLHEKSAKQGTKTHKIPLKRDEI